MNSCGQEGVHYTMAFTLSMITSRPLEAWRVVVVIFYFFWRKQVTRKTTGGLVQLFFPLHCVCHAASGELQHPWASWKWLQALFFLFFCKSTVCNDHLSVWSVSSESCWVALQEMQGGNSYLTCTVDSVQLTERCHLWRRISALDYKHTHKSQSRAEQTLLQVAQFLGTTTLAHLYTDNTLQMIKLLGYSGGCYSEHCSVILAIHTCWKWR